MSSSLELYMKFMLEHLEKEKNKLESKLKVQPIEPMDFVFEGKVSMIKSIIKTIERDLNFLQQEMMVEDGGI